MRHTSSLSLSMLYTLTEKHQSNYSYVQGCHTYKSQTPTFLKISYELLHFKKIYKLLQCPTKTWFSELIFSIPSPFSSIHKHQEVLWDGCFAFIKTYIHFLVCRTFELLSHQFLQQTWRSHRSGKIQVIRSNSHFFFRKIR